MILILILLVSNNQPQDRDPHNRSVGSNAAASGGHCGVFRTTRISQRQNSHPDKVKNAAPINDSEILDLLIILLTN